jgi:hypothetical protein
MEGVEGVGVFSTLNSNKKSIRTGTLATLRLVFDGPFEEFGKKQSSGITYTVYTEYCFFPNFGKTEGEYGINS